jgi:hypothetical protein
MTPHSGCGNGSMNHVSCYNKYQRERYSRTRNK